MRTRRSEDDNPLGMGLAALVASLLVFASLPGTSQNNGANTHILSWAFLGGNPIIFLPLLTLGVIGGIWLTVEREPLNRSIVPEYGPPPDLSPAEASALLDDSVKACAIISTIVDLAVRGYLRIEREEGHGKQSMNENYVFHNLRKPNWAKDLAPHECDLMEHIFEYGEQPSLAILRHSLPEYLAQIKEHIFKSLAVKKMYRLDPILGRIVLLLGGFAALLVLWLLAKALGIQLTEYNILNPVCFTLAMVVIFFFSNKITLKSALGRKRWCQVKGFQEFMKRVEKDRMKSILPDTFEKFLPYAIALGVETEWSTTFKEMLTKPPNWDTGALGDLLPMLAAWRNLGMQE